MDLSVNFNGPFLKTQRAEHHIAHLENIFREHMRSNRQRLRAKKYRHGGKKFGLSIGFPKHTPTILGDALHNLRAALDHAYCVLIVANGHTVTNKSTFPFSPNGPWEDRRGAVNGHEKAGHGPGRLVIDHIFDVIQPYEGGNGADLLGLHLLDIADKHTSILPTAATMHIEDIWLRNEVGGELRITNMSLCAGDNPDMPFERFFGGVTGIKDDTKSKVSFEISFEEGQPFQGESIIPTLRVLSQRVNDTLSGLRRVGNEALQAR